MDSSEAERKTSSRSGLVLWSALTVGAIYGVFVLLLWRTGVLSFDASAGDSGSLAAVLGLLGGFFASSLTFVGVVLKHSLDVRNAQIAERNADLAAETEKRLALESERNEQLKRQEADRLALEASIRAVDLLSTTEGPAPALERAGALFALAYLGQVDLALTLLKELWSSGDISAVGAVSLLDQALTSGKKHLQREAAEMLEENAHRLLTEDGSFYFPSSLDEGLPDMPLFARQTIIDACLKIVISRPLDEWDSSMLVGVIVQMDAIRRHDPSPFVQAPAVLLMELLLDIPDFSGRSAQTEDGRIHLDVLRDDVKVAVGEAQMNVPEDFSQLLQEARTSWLVRTDDHSHTDGA